MKGLAFAFQNQSVINVVFCFVYRRGKSCGIFMTKTLPWKKYQKN